MHYSCLGDQNRRDDMAGARGLKIALYVHRSRAWDLCLCMQEQINQFIMFTFYASST